MARESNLQSLTESEKSTLITDFNAGDSGDREKLAAEFGYSSEKSLRNSMASMWGRQIFTTARNIAPQQKAETLETIKAKAVPVKFSSLWSSMSSFVEHMPKAVLADNGEIDGNACKWLQAALDSEAPNPFIVSLGSWPRTEMESVFMLLGVEDSSMKAARLSREASEREADRKRVEALESKGFVVVAATDDKVARMIDHHKSISSEIDGEIKRLNGKPDSETVADVRRKIEISGRGHSNMVKSFASLEGQYSKAIEKLTVEIERLKEYQHSCLQVDGRLQIAVDRINKLLPSEPKKPALTEVQQAAIAAMVAAGLTDAQARSALGL